jgi:hypothetical protein
MTPASKHTNPLAAQKVIHERTLRLECLKMAQVGFEGRPAIQLTERAEALWDFVINVTDIDTTPDEAA